MFFLIEYDRESGKIVTFRSFRNSDKEEAEHSRLEKEIELNRRGVEREVVILEAPTEAAVRRTHRRYFESLRELVETS